MNMFKSQHLSDNSRAIRFKCSLQNTIIDVLRGKGWQEVKEGLVSYTGEITHSPHPVAHPSPLHVLTT
jgi:hypothetical protein